MMELGHSEAEKNGLLEKKPWVMIAPMLSSKNTSSYMDMKSKYGASNNRIQRLGTIFKQFSFGRRADYSIPLSDHCDFNELSRFG